MGLSQSLSLEENVYTYKPRYESSWILSMMPSIHTDFCFKPGNSCDPLGQPLEEIQLLKLGGLYEQFVKVRSPANIAFQGVNDKRMREKNRPWVS